MHLSKYSMGWVKRFWMGSTKQRIIISTTVHHYPGPFNLCIDYYCSDDVSLIAISIISGASNWEDSLITYIVHFVS